METLYPNPSPNWFAPQPVFNSVWTKEENKKFEQALAIYDKNTADRWDKIARMLPGKSVSDVINQYRELEDDVSDIEAGLVPIPGYLASSFVLDLVDDRRFDGVRKRSSPHSGSADHEKKKGVPWTEDEHKRFLMGLVKHGKGDWRNISRNFVVTKTPTQVASHAQKYFIRLNAGVKDKRRPSIHDITTGTLAESITKAEIPKEEAEEKMMKVKDRLEEVFMLDLAQRDLFMNLPLPSAYETDSLPEPKVLGPYKISAHDGHHSSMLQAQSSRQGIIG